jgi:hypothetical protein
MIKESQTPCFECGQPAAENHHVVPRSLGGTKTIPLCCGCHDKAHRLSRLGGRNGLTKAALQAKRKRSERVGSIPYGYRLDTDGIHLVEDQAEQEAVCEILALRAGGMSLRAIVAELDARGYQARGNRWHVSTIVRILEAA